MLGLKWRVQCLLRTRLAGQHERQDGWSLTWIIISCMVLPLFLESLVNNVAMVNLAEVRSSMTLGSECIFNSTTQCCLIVPCPAPGFCDIRIQTAPTYAVCQHIHFISFNKSDAVFLPADTILVRLLYGAHVGETYNIIPGW